MFIFFVLFSGINQCLTELPTILNLAKKYITSNNVLPNDKEKMIGEIVENKMIGEIVENLQKKEKEASQSERNIITDCIHELKNI